MKELINVKKIVVIFLTFISVFMLLILSFDYFFWWPSFKKNIRKVAPPPRVKKTLFTKNISMCASNSCNLQEFTHLFKSMVYVCSGPLNTK